MALENTRARFDASYSNGIQSAALEVDDGSRTIRIGAIAKDCPIDMIEASPSSTSFLQLGKSQIESRKQRLKNSKLNKQNIKDSKSSAATSRKRTKELKIKPHNNLNQLKQQDELSQNSINSRHNNDKISFLQIAEVPLKLTEPVRTNNLSICLINRQIDKQMN